MILSSPFISPCLCKIAPIKYPNCDINCLYQEAAHYARQHHQKILMTSAAISSIAICGLMAFNKS